MRTSTLFIAATALFAMEAAPALAGGPGAPPKLQVIRGRVEEVEMTHSHPLPERGGAYFQDQEVNDLFRLEILAEQGSDDIDPQRIIQTGARDGGQLVRQSSFFFDYDVQILNAAPGVASDIYRIILISQESDFVSSRGYRATFTLLDPTGQAIGAGDDPYDFNFDLFTSGEFSIDYQDSFITEEGTIENTTMSMGGVISAVSYEIPAPGSLSMMAGALAFGARRRRQRS